MKKTKISLAIIVWACSTAPSIAQNIDMNTVMLDPTSKETNQALSQSGPMEGIFAAQKQMVYNVLKEMNIDPATLPPDIKAEIDRPQTSSLPALISFSKGMDELDSGNFADAQKFFADASAKDPSFSLAAQLKEVMPNFNASQMKASGNSPAKEAKSETKEAAKETKSETKENTKAATKEAKTETKENNSKPAKSISAFIGQASGEKAKETARIIAKTEGDNPPPLAILGMMAPPPPPPADDMPPPPAATADGTAPTTLPPPTNDTTKEQNIVNNYQTAENSNLVEGGTFGGNAGSSYPTLRGFLVAYLSQYSGPDVYAPYRPFINQNPIGITKDAYGIFGPTQGFSLPQFGGDPGYMQFDANGDLIAFRDYYAASVFKENLSLPVDPHTSNTPDIPLHEFTYPDGMRSGEYVVLDRSDENSFVWQSSDNTDYQYTLDGFYFAGGSPVNSSIIADLATNNAIYNYSGKIELSVVGFGPSVEGTVGVAEHGSGDFNATVNFGSQQLTSFSAVGGKVETTNYQVSFGLNSPVPLTTDGKLFDTSIGTGIDIDIGNRSGSPAPSDIKVVSGAIAGSGAEGMVGVFAARAFDGSNSFFTQGGIVGTKN